MIAMVFGDTRRSVDEVISPRFFFCLNSSLGLNSLNTLLTRLFVKQTQKRKTMKTKWFIYLVVALFSFSFVACGDDDEGGTRENPSTAADPVGTVVTNLANSNSVTIGYGSIKLNTSNNLQVSGCEIVSVGSVNGLSSINKVPENGWSRQVSAIPGYGYIIRWATSSSYDESSKTIIYTYGYARLYVVDWMTSTTGGIMGCTVKYQEWTPTNK
jgi:hypothetical protein